MGLVRIATAAAERLADQDVARENARMAATMLAQSRVDRLEVEQFLESQAQDRRAPRPVLPGALPRAGRYH